MQFFLAPYIVATHWGQMSVHTLPYPPGRPTGSCRLVLTVKMFFLSDPDVSASRNAGKVSWPGTGCKVCHLTTPGQHVAGEKKVTNRENVRYVQRYFRGNLGATAPEEEGREVQHLGPEVTSDVMLLGIIIMRKLLKVTFQSKP